MQTILPSQQDLRKKLFHKQTQIISDQQKFPQLFKWKTATLIMGAVSAILLIILLVVVYNIQSQQQITKNLTFISNIISQTQILQNKQQINNLSHNFQQIYGTTKFQNAKLVYRGSQLTQQSIRHSIYGQQNQKLLYLVQIDMIQGDNKSPVRLAAFMNSEFPMPKDQDFNQKMKYYSFEIKQQRKSSLLGLYTQQSLKLYSQNPQIKSIKQCRNYVFEAKPQSKQGQQLPGSFKLLQELINFNLQTKQVKINSNGWKCFTPKLQSPQQMYQILQTMLDPKILNPDIKLQLVKVQVFYLS